MDLQLGGRRALVTGGTRGIGRAIVAALADEGASVAFCARDADEVATVSDTLAEAGTRTVGRTLDVTDGEALRGWVEEAAEELGGLDVVVANVSALSIGDTEANWQAGYETDMLSTVRLVQAALPHLRESDAASIVTISSVSGREIDFAAGAYGTFRAAVVHYTQGLAYQLAPEGIRANSVSPGNVYFAGGVWPNTEANDPELFSHALGLNPTGRMARPEEVARAVAFLAAPASTFISGTNLLVDGALTRGVQF
jgi:NAD(P)-dependent dehydrogenase (short-subunit alcohol dehydrogenase family)